MGLQEIWTIGRILKWTEKFFRGKGMDTPRLDAEVLLSAVLGQPRIHLYVHFDQPLVPEELARYRAMVKQRAVHVPVAYILGEKEFMGLTFKVTEATLIPRPDTEILVETAIELLGKGSYSVPIAFADIGTGTGAVCLSVLSFLKKAGRHALADTVDISKEVRSAAEENARTLGLSEDCRFYTGDLLMPLAGKTYAAILSNPPYIPEDDIAALAPEVRLKEPKTALAGGADGLAFYRRLAAEAPSMLYDGGFLAVEVGAGQAEQVAELFTDGGLKNAETRKDLAGIVRVVLAWKR